MRKFVLISFSLFLFTAPSFAGITATFEDQGLSLNSHLNNVGGAATGTFNSFGNALNNEYSFIPNFGGIWSGWAMSTETAGTTAGYENQYSSKPGTGAGGSNTYAVAFTAGGNTDPFHPAGSYIDLAAGLSPSSIDITNTAYAYYAMRDGYMFSNAFGPDSFLKLDIQGYDSLGGTGTLLGTVDYYLADYRGGQTFILDSWLTLDLSSLAGAKSLRFGLQSSDNDSIFGMNTPAYLAVDNLRLQAVPEPSSILLSLVGVALASAAVRWKRRSTGYNGAASSVK